MTKGRTERGKRGTDRSTVIAIISAIISLGTLLWTVRFADLTVTFSTVAASIRGGDHLVVPITFSNDGSQATTITDVLLQEKWMGRTSTYTTWFSIKPDSIEAFLHDPTSSGATTPFIQSDFAPFTLPGETSVTRVLVFNHFSHSPALFAQGRAVAYRVIAHATSGDATNEHCVIWPETLAATFATGGGAMEQVDSNIAWRLSYTATGAWPTTVPTCTKGTTVRNRGLRPAE